MSLPFVDSNILVYASTESSKSEVARQILESPFNTGLQALNETVRVLLQKLRLPISEVARSSLWLRTAASLVAEPKIDDHIRAFDIVDQHKLQWWDAMLAATALRVGATTFLSEDMHAGLVIGGQMTIINPFRA